MHKFAVFAFILLLPVQALACEWSAALLNLETREERTYPLGAGATVIRMQALFECEVEPVRTVDLNGEQLNMRSVSCSYYPSADRFGTTLAIKGEGGELPLVATLHLYKADPKARYELTLKCQTEITTPVPVLDLED